MVHRFMFHIITLIILLDKNGYTRLNIKYFLFNSYWNYIIYFTKSFEPLIYSKYIYFFLLSFISLMDLLQYLGNIADFYLGFTLTFFLCSSSLTFIPHFHYNSLELIFFSFSKHIYFKIFIILPYVETHYRFD